MNVGLIHNPSRSVGLLSASPMPYPCRHPLQRRECAKSFSKYFHYLDRVKTSATSLSTRQRDIRNSNPPYQSPKPYQSPQPYGPKTVQAPRKKKSKSAASVTSKFYGSPVNYKSPAPYNSPRDYGTKNYTTARRYSGGAGGGGRGRGGRGGGGGGDGNFGEPERGGLLVQLTTATYAVLLVAGGAAGYFKKRSRISLVCGLLMGSVQAYAAVIMSTNPMLAIQLALGTSVGTLILSSTLYWRTGRFVPSGLLSIVSLLLTGGYTMQISSNGSL